MVGRSIGRVSSQRHPHDRATPPFAQLATQTTLEVMPAKLETPMSFALRRETDDLRPDTVRDTGESAVSPTAGPVVPRQRPPKILRKGAKPASPLQSQPQLICALRNSETHVTVGKPARAIAISSAG